MVFLPTVVATIISVHVHDNETRRVPVKLEMVNSPSDSASILHTVAFELISTPV